MRHRNLSAAGGCRRLCISGCKMIQSRYFEKIGANSSVMYNDTTLLVLLLLYHHHHHHHQFADWVNLSNRKIIKSRCTYSYQPVGWLDPHTMPAPDVHTHTHMHTHIPVCIHAHAQHTPYHHCEAY
jgi:hypothetical protein